MLCSTVIPTIGRSTLARAVESALAQEIEDHEILVVNDGGRPLEDQDWMRSPQVQILNTQRAGVTFVCNAGAAHARGRYLKFLHDDDYLLPGGLRAMIEAAQSADRRWIIGSAQVVDDDGAPISEIASGATGNLLASILAGEAAHMSYCLIERKAFLDAGGFDSQMKIYEDGDLCWRLALRHDVGSTPQKVACVRISGSAGSAFDFNVMPTYFRLLRERILNTPEAFARVRDSAHHSPAWIRGGVLRQSLVSAALHLRAGRVWMALSRLSWCARAPAAGSALFTAAFWRGVLLRRG